MKKKGLIISTVVMVVVLIASLTTATYAWFTTSNITKIDGFDVSVTAGNVMNIGLNGSGLLEYNASAGPDQFVSGACEYVAGSTDGNFAGGHWTGEVGSLGSTVSHNIKWQEQGKAVGFSTADALVDVNFANTKLANQANWKSIVAANGNATKMESIAFANANIGKTAEAPNGDYVYMFLGAQPTKSIQADTNNLYIVVQPQGNGTTIGMAAAIHVAYKVNGDTEWTDVGLFDGKSYKDARTSKTAVIYGDASGDSFTVNTATFNETTKQTTITSADVVTIPLTACADISAGAPLDQIQLLIYIAGSDPDCVDAAKTGSVHIGIFFGAQEATTTTGGGETA